jgi:hypothetical protein
MACTLADRSNQSYLVRLEATVFGDRLGCRDSLDRLTAGGFVAAWSAKKHAALFARSKRSEGILQNVEVENVVEPRDSGSWCCGTRRPRFE